MKDDLISRKAAIEEMLKCGEYYNGNDEAKRGVAQCIGVIHELPSAQPEKRTEERTETHACDCISRQAAIEALDALCDRECEYSKKQRSVMCGACHLGSAFDVVEQLPSAQPERLTDDDFETIRIHLNAYKEKLCNQQRWEEADEYQRIIDRFMAFASAQPEIIRCKDCKYRGVGDYCVYGTRLAWVTKSNDFCSKAERRGG